MAEAPRSGAAVAVLEADDVVLVQLVADLHLDQDEHLVARVLDPVAGTQRQVDRLGAADLQHLVAAGHPPPAADHDPVLGAVVVELEREHGTRLDGDPLDREALTRVEDLPAAPGPLVIVAALVADLGHRALRGCKDESPADPGSRGACRRAIPARSDMINLSGAVTPAR